MSHRFYSHERNWGCRISEYVYRGLRCVTLENEQLRVSVLADKGADIFEFLYKPKDVDVMWRSWQGVVDPRAMVPSVSHPEGNFLDCYEGGWQELFPAGGDPGIYKGARQGLHGEVALQAWQYRVLRDDPEEVAVQFQVRTRRTPFLLEKTLRLRRKQATLFVSEQATNEGNEPMAYMWAHHPALGWPFLDETCAIDLPGAKVRTLAAYPTSRLAGFQDGVWPHFPSAREPGKTVDLSRVPPVSDQSHDDCYLHDLKGGWYAVTSGRLGVGFALCWPLEVFPYAGLWTVYGGAMGYPWYGTNYNLALEPFSSFPHGIDRAVEAGAAPVLGPGESQTAWLEATAYEGRSPVREVVRGGIVQFQ